MAVTENMVDEFLKKVEQEIQDNEAKLEKVRSYLSQCNIDPSLENNPEVKKLMDDAEKKATFEANQRVAQMNNSSNSNRPNSSLRRRGLAI